MLGPLILKRARQELPLHEDVNRSMMIDRGAVPVQSSDEILKASRFAATPLTTRLKGLCTRNEAFAMRGKPCKLSAHLH
jgi:hypothetical protein